jgi:Sulfotransferase family
MIISNSRKFVFIHIHKTGGTSMEIALDPYLSWNDIVLGGSEFGVAIEMPYARRFGLSKHSTLEALCNLCGSEILRDYYVFALVRNPLDRICSLYNFVGNIVENSAGELNIQPKDLTEYVSKFPDTLQSKRSLTWPSTVAFLQTSCFSEFLRSSRAAQDMGFRSQVSSVRLSPQSLLSVETYKLEEIGESLPIIRKRIGLDFAFPHQNKSRRVFVTPELVSNEDKRYIESLYAEDYAAFGYQES